MRIPCSYATAHESYTPRVLYISTNVDSLFSSLQEHTRKGLVFFIKSFVLPPQKPGVLSPWKERGERLAIPFRATIASFSPLQKKIFSVCLVLWGASTIGFLFMLNTRFLVEVPMRGGALIEGAIGTPRFINPLLAISDTDRDLTALVYSGLLRATPSGELIPDLAEKYVVSPDGLTYTFTLKEELFWHDGEPVTADDVVLTITRVQDPLLKSPKRASWEGVHTKKIDERTVEFSLEQPYSPFLENTANLGILPAHLWGKISAEQFSFAKFNETPIGSGPYKIKELRKDNAGIPAYYDLVPFSRFSLGRPFVADIRFRFYANEESLLAGLTSGEIDAVNAITPQKAREFVPSEGRAVEQYRLPRVFGIFLNQNQNTLFTQKPVREALDTVVDRREITAAVLDGFGTPLTGPLPPGALGFSEEANEEATDADARTEAALAILKKAGWKPNAKTGVMEKVTKSGTELLSFSLAVPDTEEVRRAAELVKAQWEGIGAKVTMRVFDQSDLHQSIIRPRKYDALFFGEIIGRESDPFAFWHSSQRNDPGLNIALYANIAVDTLLSRGRTTLERAERIKIYEEFEDTIKKDIPAIFVYSPDFLYVHPAEVQGIAAGTITISSERFLDVHTWFIKTDKVWKIFQ